MNDDARTYASRIHFSLLTSHFSLLTSHFSLLTFHFSLFTFHFSLLTSHFSLLISHFSFCPVPSCPTFVPSHHGTGKLLKTHGLDEYFPLVPRILEKM